MHSRRQIGALIVLVATLLAGDAHAQLQREGTCETLRDYALGNLRLTELHNSKICYRAISLLDGVRYQEVEIRASGQRAGKFHYGSAERPLLAGTMTHLAINGVTNGRTLTVKRDGFQATVRITDYKIPPLLDGTIVLPSRRVWLANKESISIEPGGPGEWHSTGLFEFDTDNVRLTDAIVRVRDMSHKWTRSFRSSSDVRLAMDLAGASVTLRSGSFATEFPATPGPVEIPTSVGPVRLNGVTGKGLSLAVTPTSIAATARELSATAGGLLEIGRVPVVLSGEWKARLLVMNASRDDDAFSIGTVTGHAFQPLTSAAAILASDEQNPWRLLLAKIGWLHPDAQRERAIEHARTQLAVQSQPAIFALLRTDDVAPLLNEFLATVGAPIKIEFGKQVLRVATDANAPLPVPLAFEMFLALSAEDRDLLLWPAISLATIGAQNVPAATPASALWSDAVSRIAEYVEKLTSQPLRIALPNLVPETIDLTDLKAVPPAGGPLYSVKLHQKEIKVTVVQKNPVLLIAPDGIRALMEVATQ